MRNCGECTACCFFTDGADYVEISGSAATFEGEQLVDYLSDTELYRAEAETGSTSSQAVWRIRHITVALDGTSATTLWAEGTENFDKIWDDRASYSYS